MFIVGIIIGYATEDEFFDKSTSKIIDYKL